MKYKLTPLNVPAFLFIIGCLIFTGINYSTLSNGEGWGVVNMVALLVIGVIALLVDLLIQRFITSRDIRLFLCIVAVLIGLAILLT